MARQVISYDDLAPEGTVPGAVPSNSSDTLLEETNQHAVLSVHSPSSPTPKKRKRDEADVHRSVSGGVGGKINNTGKIPSENAMDLSSPQTMPPKPQVKKRGRNKRRNGGSSDTGASSSLPIQHWDDPGAQADGIWYGEGAAEASGAIDDLNGGAWENDGNGGGALDAEGADVLEGEEEEDESRELTHEEIWDDSALVAAWDAANEEYEAMHGKTKRWKRERVHKSPLWYNVPPEKSVGSTNSKESRNKAAWKTDGSSPAAGKRSHEDSEGKGDGAYSSAPLNFETYVPTHDPSLAFSAPSHPPTVPEPTQTQTRNIASHYASMLPGSLTSTGRGSSVAQASSGLGSFAVSADEAFSRACGAMYWCGYWTAVYHVQRAHEQGAVLTEDNLEVNVTGDLVEEKEGATEFVSTQR